MTSSILDAMHAAGLAPHKALELREDGKLTRYRVQGDKPGSRNGWAVAYNHPINSGAFGSWKTGATHTWREASSKPQTSAELAELQRQIKAMQAARDAERDQVQATARERAAKLWGRARHATNVHP